MSLNASACSHHQTLSASGSSTQQGSRCRFVAPFDHIDHRAIDRVDVRDLAGALPAVIVRLDDIGGLGIVSVDEPGIGSDLGDPDETAKNVETVVTEEDAKGVMTRALPDSVPGRARGRADARCSRARRRECGRRDRR